MASNLAGATCIGNYDLCVVRAGRLSATCAPVYGANNGIITAAFVTVDAAAEVEDNADVEQKNGCGAFMFKVAKQDKVKARNLSGTIGLHDWEMCELLFGGTLILGAVGSSYAGEVIGWAEPGPNSADRNPITFEVITKVAGQGVGNCATSTGVFPQYTGWIFPKVFLTFGDRSFAEGAQVINFTGVSEPNPAYFTGPFRDWDNASQTVFPTDSPMVAVGYETLPLNGLSAATCGYQTTPASS